MAKRGYQTITIEKLFGGWISSISGSGTTSLDASLEGADNQYAQSTSISLFRLEKLGHIAPGEVMTAITDSSSFINSLPLNGDVASNSRAFFILQNSRVVRTDTDGIVTTDGTDIAIATTGHTNHTVEGTSYAPDLIIVRDAANPSNERILYSWADGIDGDVGIMGTDFAAIDHDWYSTLSGTGTLSARVPLKLCQGPDGNIYITNGQYIATASMSAGIAITAATKSFRALNLGAGWIAMGITAYRSFVAIIGFKGTAGTTSLSRSQCRVWLWDGFNSEPNHIYDLPDNIASGIFYDSLNLYAITSGRGNSTRLWKFNGMGFEEVFVSDIVVPDSPIGSAILRSRQGSIEYYQNSLLFTWRTNEMYQYFAGGLHQRMILTTGTNATDCGMLKNLYQKQLFAGALVSGINRVLYQNQFTQYYINADFRSKLYQLPYRSTIRRIKLYFSQFGAGASVLVSLFKDYDTLSIGGNTDLLNYTISNAQFGILRSHEIICNISDVNSFYLNVRFNHSAVTNTAAIIRKIEIDYEVVDV